MTPGEVLHIASLTLWTVIKIAAPVMVVGMTVGLIVALFQAMTQIQEMTLAFVPKIIAIFLALLFFGPGMGVALHELSEYVFNAMIQLDKA